ncbi:hypothetical protein NEIG_00321 [Nematocida sp. ERTm5]|nr:hypothetical protein NEIG_00321 [Nematocida sp. ERTm5]
MKRSRYIYTKLILATVYWISIQEVAGASGSSSFLLDKSTAIYAEDSNSPCILDPHFSEEIKSLIQNSNDTNCNFMIPNADFNLIRKVNRLSEIIKKSYLIIYKKPERNNLLVFQIDMDKQEVYKSDISIIHDIQQISIKKKSFENSTNTLMHYTEFTDLKTQIKYLINTHAYAVDKNTIIDQYIKAYPKKSEIDENTHIWEDVIVIEMCNEPIEIKMKSSEIDPESGIYTYGKIDKTPIKEYTQIDTESPKQPMQIDTEPPKQPTQIDTEPPKQPTQIDTEPPKQPTQIDNAPSGMHNDGVVYRKKGHNTSASIKDRDNERYLKEAKNQRDSIYRKSMSLLNIQNVFDMEKASMDGGDKNNLIIKKMKSELDAAFESIYKQIKESRGSVPSGFLNDIKNVLYESFATDFSAKDSTIDNSNQSKNNEEVLNQNNLKSIYAKIDEDNTALDPHSQKEWSLIYSGNQSEPLELAEITMNYMEDNNRFKYGSENKIAQVDIMFKKIRDLIASDVKSSVRITMDVSTKKKAIKLECNKIFNKNEDSENISDKDEMILECRAIENIKKYDSDENASTTNHLKQTKKHEKSFLLMTFTDTKGPNSKFHVTFNNLENNDVETISDNFSCIDNLDEMINRMEKSFISEAFVNPLCQILEGCSDGSSPEPLTPIMGRSDNEATTSEEEIDRWDDNV